MLDSAADLLLGGSCLGCGRAGRSLCRACRESLVPDVRHVHRSGIDVPVIAAGAYEGVLQRLVPAHKDAQAFQLAKPLGALLAHAIVAHGLSATVLVPMPSAGAAVRERGYDHALELVRAANRWLDPQLQLTRLLRVSAHADQANLAAGARAANLQGHMRATEGSLQVLLCDDVVTTGSSIIEAIRALKAAGHTVVGAAVIAETPRRNV